MTNRRPYPNIWPTHIAKQKTQAENVLIIDSSSLHDLANPIPKTFFNWNEDVPLKERPVSYLDTLKYLPQKAVGKILIPDIVALEAAGFSTLEIPRRHGRTVLWKIDPPQERESFNLRQRQAFIKDVIDGKYPNVEIVHSRHTFFYMQNMKRAYRQLKRLSDEAGKPLPGKEEAFDRAQRFFYKLKEQNGGFDRGEEQCVQVAMDYAANHDATVSVLSEDIWGQGLLKKRVEVFHEYRKKKCPSEQGSLRPQDEMRIYDINSLGYLKALFDSGIMVKDVGLHPAITLERCQHAFNTHERNMALLKVQRTLEKKAHWTEVATFEQLDPQTGEQMAQPDIPNPEKYFYKKEPVEFQERIGKYFKNKLEKLNIPYEEDELVYKKKQYVHDRHHHAGQKTFVDFVAQRARQEAYISR